MTTASVEGSVANELEKENRNEEEKEDYEENAASSEGAFHSSTATITSSTTSQASSNESRKSKKASGRRESLRRDKLGSCLMRSYDPMQVVTPEQLEGFSFLVSTPIWIFDFIARKNRYANPAALDLWSAPSLEEFLSRDMSDMSAASESRTQECQNRVERAQVVQDIWTFYPKGKARTLQMTMTALRLSPDDDHCSILVVGNMMSPTSSLGAGNFNSRSSVSMGNIAPSPPGTTTTSPSVAGKAMPDKSKESESKQNHGNSKLPRRSKEDKPEETATDTDKTVATFESEEGTKDDSNRGTDGGPIEEEKDQDDSNSSDEENAPLNHILDTHDDSPLNQEILRGVEIIRHLPIAVCQFDMKGRLMFQNPAAYLPPLDDEEKESVDDESSMATDDESEYFDELFEEQYGQFAGLSTISSSDGRGNFMNRFVNKKVARELLESLQGGEKGSEEQSKSFLTTTSNTLTTVTVEAELYTSTLGRTQWSAIQLRKTKDPVTSRPVILFSAQDKSDAMEAKREREARMQKSEFLAIMAHEIRTPLHQVTGFIDLLELDASGNTITATASSGALGTTTKNKSFTETDKNIKNALFPCTPMSAENKIAASMDRHDRPKTVTKSRSGSLLSARNPRWSSISIPQKSIGNLTGEQKGYIKLLKSSANQLMTVINDVLDYSKLEAGKMKTERIPFELLSVVQGSMEAVRGNCEEKGLTLTLDYGGSDGDEDDNANTKSNSDSRGPNSGINDGRKRIRRRNSFDGKTNSSRRKKVERNLSFDKKKSRGPKIRSNDIPFRILGDPNRLRQVLLNLLSNAVKFTEKGGIHVRVCSFTKKNVTPAATPEQGEKRRSTSRRSSLSSSSEHRKEERKAKRRSSMSTASDSSKGLRDSFHKPLSAGASSETISPKKEAVTRHLRIVVTDTGMGISKEQQNTIFEKYQQANLSVARNFGGTGLGLSICKLLVEQTMGGTIGVDSDLGQGSSFHITLPIEVPREVNDETSRLAIGDEKNQDKGTSLKILVAEDNKINQKLVANMLKRMGHKSTLVENGRQAIDTIVESSSEGNGVVYDAVLMDIQMPVMDGLEATRRLRTSGYTDLPILGLTASVKRSDYEELGFTDWLPKPILMKDLKAKLQKLCEPNGEDSDKSSE